MDLFPQEKELRENQVIKESWDVETVQDQMVKEVNKDLLQAQEEDGGNHHLHNKDLILFIHLKKLVLLKFRRLWKANLFQKVKYHRKRLKEKLILKLNYNQIRKYININHLR